jgi:hypothetical protein
MSGHSNTLTEQTNQLNKGLAFIFRTLIKTLRDNEDIVILYLTMFIGIYS